MGGHPSQPGGQAGQHQASRGFGARPHVTPRSPVSRIILETRTRGSAGDAGAMGAGRGQLQIAHSTAPFPRATAPAMGLTSIPQRIWCGSTSYSPLPSDQGVLESSAPDRPKKGGHFAFGAVFNQFQGRNRKRINCPSRPKAGGPQHAIFSHSPGRKAAPTVSRAFHPRRPLLPAQGPRAAGLHNAPNPPWPGKGSGMRWAHKAFDP